MKTLRSKRTRLLDEECATLPCGNVRYLLLETACAPAYYAVEVALDRETVRVPLGANFFEAARFLEQAVKGGVTPCTLAEIAADWHAERSGKGTLQSGENVLY